MKTIEPAHMESVTAEALAALLGARDGPCYSIYLTTHRHDPENHQDPILFRTLSKQVKELLHHQCDPAEVETLMEPLDQLGEDREFWAHTMNGLAILGAPGFFKVFGLQREVPELAVVAPSFHTKPLRRFMQTADHFQILALSRKSIVLYEGNRDGLVALEFAAGVPHTIEEALGEKYNDPEESVSSYSGTGAATTSMHHGHGGKRDLAEIQDERFFRVVDRTILEHHSRPSGLPLLLVALPEHQGTFHQLSHNPFLLKEGIKINPEALDLDDLRARAWEIVEPRYLAGLDKLAEEYGLANSRHQGVSELEEVALAAAEGKITTLLLEANRHITGILDAKIGHIELANYRHPPVENMDDLLDDLGEQVIAKGGRVVILPKDKMPTQTGAAAILRF